MVDYGRYNFNMNYLIGFDICCSYIYFTFESLHSFVTLTAKTEREQGYKYKDSLILDYFPSVALSNNCALFKLNYRFPWVCKIRISLKYILSTIHFVLL